MAKATKTATKKAEPKKVGHMNITLFNDESVTVDVDCPNPDLIAALASIIASNDQASKLIRTALAVVATSDIFEDEDEKPKKKKAASKKK
jgi:hypothetical protein